jgi:hypothetical protein
MSGSNAISGIILVGTIVVAAAADGPVRLGLALARRHRRRSTRSVASHWGINGTADGFSSLNGVLAVMPGRRATARRSTD